MGTTGVARWGASGGVADGGSVEEEVRKRGEGREGGVGGGEAFDVEPAASGVDFAAVPEVEMEGDEGGGMGEEVLDGSDGLELGVAGV